MSDKVKDISESSRVNENLSQDKQCPYFNPAVPCSFCGSTGIVSGRKLENMGSFEQNCKAKQ
jgi:hypothetical protein